MRAPFLEFVPEAPKQISFARLKTYRLVRPRVEERPEVLIAITWTAQSRSSTSSTVISDADDDRLAAERGDTGGLCEEIVSVSS